MIPEKRQICLLLQDIRSVHNVGSIFRTAECAGVSKIYCAGTTPVPLDRFGCKRQDFAKVALGSEDMVAWEHVDEPAGIVKEFKKKGFQIIAVEQAKKSVDYRKIKAGKKTLFILGNEVDGVSKSLLKLAHTIAEITLLGQKESLNVAVTAGIMLFSALRSE